MVNNKNVILLMDSEVHLSKEYFYSRKPVIQRLFIWIITAILFITLFWLGFANFEEVLKINGTIRPVENISTVQNIISGKISNVSYKTGQVVTKGEILLEIDPTQLESQKNSLQMQIRENEQKLKALNYIQLSIQTEKNKIPSNFKEASLRFDVWKNTLSRLKKISELHFKELEEEQMLPISMTTEKKLRDLQSQYEISLNDYQNSYLSFIHDVLSEIDTLILNNKLNYEKLIQVEDSLINTKIKAPISGFIQETKAVNIDDWVTSGQELLRIVPFSENSLKVQLNVPANQAGKLEKGMTVKMRFPSLPYNEFGGAEGKIISIDPDIKPTQNNAYFVVLCDLDKEILQDKKGKKYPLKVGLNVNARVILSKKTILAYFLEKMNLWW